jgi:hypothetical protein
MYISIYSDTRIEPPLRAAMATPMGPRKRLQPHVRTHARIGGAAAHNRPRRIEAPPSASAVVRAAGPGAAHTVDNVVTAAVFHAPMLALNADAEENACAPKPHAVHDDGHGLARLRVSGFRPRPQHEPANACAHSRSVTIAH